MACWFGFTPGTPNPPQLRIEAAVKLVGRNAHLSQSVLATGERDAGACCRTALASLCRARRSGISSSKPSNPMLAAITLTVCSTLRAAAAMTSVWRVPSHPRRRAGALAIEGQLCECP